MLRGAVLFVIAVAALGLAAPAPAAPSAPCWKRLLMDWSDGRIDHTYPIGCYRQTLARMPEDLKVYSSAPDDIQAALQKRVHARASSTRSLAVHEPQSGGSSAGWTSALPVVGLAGAGSLALAGALGFVTRGRRRRG